MLLFNDIIHHLDLVDAPLKNGTYIWSNMQDPCLLEKLDWVFTSSSWTVAFPNTMTYALPQIISDHVPYVVQMESSIPRVNIFRFENYWISFPDFLPTVSYFWNRPVHKSDIAHLISAKLKVLGRGLKAWSRELSKLNKLINNSSFALAILDGLEEQRPLSLLERNFRQQLKIHLLNLLEAKRVYWKQRSTIRWVKFGDENTKLFHAIATQKHRKNFVSQLQLLDGSMAFEHDHKAAVLWSSYKDRLGQQEYSSIIFDLSDFINPVELQGLDNPFTMEEIDAIVANLPIDKSHGLDGFNGLFIKKCWSIIKVDFYALFDGFYKGQADLQSINNSFITLMPNSSTPSGLNDFIPISLLGGPIKLITKLLAERLQKVITKLIMLINMTL
jgi:hypothetical protein